jgi:hypothetical protein
MLALGENRFRMPVMIMTMRIGLTPFIMVPNPIRTATHTG